MALSDSPMRQRAARMSPVTRRTLQVLGPLFLISGLVVGFVLPIFSAIDLGSSFLGGDGGGAASSFGKIPLYMFSGFLLIATGLLMTQFGYMRVVSGVMATETAPAVEHAAGAAGRGLGGGLREAGFGAGGGASEQIRVRCRGCGYLDSEDARYCSGCGSPM